MVIASAIDFEISDLPPPETVDGLWHAVAVADVPMMVHCTGSRRTCFITTRKPVVSRYVVSPRNGMRMRPASPGHVIDRS